MSAVARVADVYRKKTATPADCVRSSQAGTKLDRTQTAEKLLRFVVEYRIKKLPRFRIKAKSINAICMTTLLEFVVFLAPPLRPDADRPCALRLAGAVSTVEPM